MQANRDTKSSQLFDHILKKSKLLAIIKTLETSLDTLKEAHNDAYHEVLLNLAGAHFARAILCVGDNQSKMLNEEIENHYLRAAHVLSMARESTMQHELFAEVLLNHGVLLSENSKCRDAINVTLAAIDHADAAIRLNTTKLKKAHSVKYKAYYNLSLIADLLHKQTSNPLHKQKSLEFLSLANDSRVLFESITEIDSKEPKRKAIIPAILSSERIKAGKKIKPRISPQASYDADSERRTLFIIMDELLEEIMSLTDKEIAKITPQDQLCVNCYLFLFAQALTKYLTCMRLSGKHQSLLSELRITAFAITHLRVMPVANFLQTIKDIKSKLSGILDYVKVIEEGALPAIKIEKYFKRFNAVIFHGVPPHEESVRQIGRCLVDVLQMNEFNDYGAINAASFLLKIVGDLTQNLSVYVLDNIRFRLMRVRAESEKDIFEQCISFSNRYNVINFNKITKNEIEDIIQNKTGITTLAQRLVTHPEEFMKSVLHAHSVLNSLPSAEARPTVVPTIVIEESLSSLSLDEEEVDKKIVPSPTK